MTESENPPGWPESTSARLVFGHDAGFDFCDRLRLWEVRRVCQVKPSLATYMRSSRAVVEEPSRSDDGDYSLTAILRCVMDRVDADVAFVSLLDAERQYFISGASRSDEDWEASAPIESTRWFGCDSIFHAGQLCHRTLQINGGGVYEELDLSQQQYTKSLPIVNGDLARFKRYIGLPIVTDKGYTVGALFMFGHAAAKSGLTSKQRSYLQDSTKQVIRQLEQAVQALEWRRMTKFNTAVGSLIHTANLVQPAEHQSVERPSVQRLDSGETDVLIRRMYEKAVEVVLESYELDAVMVQEIPLHVHRTSTEHGSASGDVPSFFAQSQVDPDASFPSLSHETALAVCKAWPEGRVLYRMTDEEGEVMSSDWTDMHSDGLHLGRELAHTMPEVQQLLLMPLWDPLHERVVALMVGVANNWSRCYTRINDLVPMSVFCKGIVAQARKFESQHMDQRKTDFMGSVSHEMRSPLHGVLANVELLLTTTKCSSEQVDMLQSAAASGRQLLDSIDKVLQYCHISTRGDIPEEVVSMHERSTAVIKLPITTDEHNLGLLIEHVLSRAVISHAQWAAVTTPTDQGEAGSRRLGGSSGSTTPEAHDNLHVDTQAVSGLVARASQGRYRQVPVVFDVAQTVSVSEQDASSIQTIMENLVSNALKNTSQGCVRISLAVETVVDSPSSSIVLRVQDTGKGIPADFLKHKLFTPFAQNDSLGIGVGIGLSLVKLEVDSLGGTINIDSRRSVGTTVIVRLPVTATTSVQPLGQQQHVGGPAAKVQLYAPLKSRGEIQLADGLDMLQASLKTTLLARSQARMLDHETLESPDVMLVLKEDLPEFLRESSEKRSLPLVLLCPPVSHTGITTPPDDVSVVCPFLPVTMVAAISSLLAKVASTPAIDRPIAARNDSHAALKVLSEAVRLLHVNDQRISSLLAQPTIITDSDAEHSEQLRYFQGASQIPKDVTADPRSPSLLLVDDNLVNLKVLAMYTNKCGILAPALASGGQEAIDAHLAAISLEGHRAFDIIFMDLSMPGVSGFDATAAIRRREAKARTAVPVYIVALTGLVSAKDRKAAFEAGVDIYLTKPAKIKDIQVVVEVWRQLRLGRR
ncbi:hypothetical protein LTR78_008231 [Recurvomyces mirabilis]|uniref:histidine kinase n=1 Tax=Recurvomyces mirabilis TaxID=574656 RepID=A0AAE0WJ13_9PEZI|nr:hypothetical protein LTR78_008231 [Recurvomyces mirabilis]KAK5156516.1 hypothetical protein LTS14_004728 [Recurvomyces mirabilis]